MTGRVFVIPILRTQSKPAPRMHSYTPTLAFPLPPPLTHIHTQSHHIHSLGSFLQHLGPTRVLNDL
jgi:hypothetical protein